MNRKKRKGKSVALEVVLILLLFAILSAVYMYSTVDFANLADHKEAYAAMYHLAD